MAAKEYKPGDEVPQSGIYMVSHSEHRDDHEALLTANKPFPRCRVCGEKVSYRPVEGASPTQLDQDFADTEGHET